MKTFSSSQLIGEFVKACVPSREILPLRHEFDPSLIAALARTLNRTNGMIELVSGLDLLRLNGGSFKFWPLSALVLPATGPEKRGAWPIAAIRKAKDKARRMTA
jgi:hypothetical protein